jgi:hypothetical protein
MTQSNLKAVLARLKRIEFPKALATFWIIKRSGKPATPEYKVYFVDTEPKLQTKLAEIVEKAIAKANAVKPYDYFTEDMEADDMLGLDVAETDFDQIQQQVDAGAAAPRVHSPKELNDSWAYLIDVQVGKQRVRAVHKIVGGWALKKESLLVKVLFRDAALVDYEDAPVFQLERKIDFLAFEDMVLILDKSKFETVLNFRTGMERKRDELLTDLDGMKLLTDIGVMRDSIGTNIHLLRRVASVKKNGYYQDSKFIGELKTVCQKYGWGVSWRGEQIVVTRENTELILKLLNNDRLQSPVNAELFDVMVKNRVSP